jgi:hypothetical protein
MIRSFGGPESKQAYDFVESDLVTAGTDQEPYTIHANGIPNGYRRINASPAG